MKPSKYNYIVEYGDRVIFFNGITEQLFDIPINNRSSYETIISSPDLYSDDFGSFLMKLKGCGFIIDDDADEMDLIEHKFHSLRYESDYHVMILPTYQCNLRCWYCVQDHQDLNMSEETKDNIRILFEKIVLNPEIKRLRLSWFGGEPLLGYKTVLSLTSHAKELSNKYGKEFFCDITTNGTLLNRERIKSLREAGVSHYQITIDGTKEMHDKIKVLGNHSSFEKSMENINIIAETTSCTLRFNYTNENLNPQGIMEDIRRRIKESNRANMSFLIYKVWQEDWNKIGFSDVEKLASLSAEEGIRSKLPTTNLCYADAKNFICIFPNGLIEKCDNESPLAARGHLSDGEILWEEGTEAHIPAFRNKQFPCYKCRYIPLCWGPCVAKRDKMLRENGKGLCQYEDMDVEMERNIVNIYINTLNNRRLSEINKVK